MSDGGYTAMQTPDSRAGSAVKSSTDLAHDRTNLALKRSYFAAERTLQAWIRTALSLISFGFTLGKLGQAIQDVEMKGLFIEHTLSIRSLAYFLVVLGTVSLAWATVQHALDLRDLRAAGIQHRTSIAAIVAIVLTVIGGLALTALVLGL